MALSILSEQFCIRRPRQVIAVGQGWSWDELRTSESKQPTCPAHLHTRGWHLSTRQNPTQYSSRVGMAEAEWSRDQQGLGLAIPGLHFTAQWLLAAVAFHSLAAAPTTKVGISWGFPHTQACIPKVEGSVGKNLHIWFLPDSRGPEEIGPTPCLGGPWEGPFHAPKHLMLRAESP